MRYSVERMELEDVPQVLEVDRESYTLPWPASAYRREIMQNRNARYFVLRGLSGDDSASPEPPEPDGRPRLLPFFPWRRQDGPPRPGHIVGYSGMWLVLDEAHITTIAIRQAHRGEGLGELLLVSMIEAAAEMGSQRITLEVRISNTAAQNLYTKYGFRMEGIRKRYYSDNNEDAYIMTVDQVRSDAYRDRFDSLVAKLRRRLERPEVEIISPVFSFPEDAARARTD